MAGLLSQPWLEPSAQYVCISMNEYVIDKVNLDVLYAHTGL